MKKAAWVLLILGIAALVAGVFPLLQLMKARTLSEQLTQELSAAERFCTSAHPTEENEALAEMLTQDYSKPEMDDTHVYTSPEGIVFHSGCDAWDEENLEALYQELLQNRHGEELYSLTEVVVYPQSDDFAAATHELTMRSTDFWLRMPCMPDWPVFTLSEDAGVITLYDGEELTTVAEMADSLSHEYGHHYTFYYMLDSDQPSSYWDSEYASLRGLTSDNARIHTWNTDVYYENHQDYLEEIAAEDYVTLMGSPNSRSVAEYKDVREQLNGETGDQTLLRNALPQENMSLPMAADVPGLADYFYSFLDEAAPEPLTDRDFHIQLTRHSASYDLTIGHRTYVNYTVTWDKLYGDEAVYTLISCGEDEEEYMPIRTVTDSERAEATIGSVTHKSGTNVSIYDDELAHGTRTFLITAILPDGRICVSEPLTYTF